MAPEVVMNKGVHRKADVWSLGCLIIEMALAGNPWGNETFDNNFQAIMRIADPSQCPSVPDRLSALCKDFLRKCLQREQTARPSTQELLQHPWLL